MQRAYVVVVPVKPPAFGKSRLQGLSDAQRRDLAGAFARDTIAACLEASLVDEVLVATDDAAFAATLAGSGCATIPDGDTRGLNAALRQAVSEARRRWPALQPVALLADLPALRATDLDAALGSLAPDGQSFVADADGTGTTLYTSSYDEFAPAFGPNSRVAHRAGGAVELMGELARLRRDVDNLEDLRAAVTLGVGAETALLVAALNLH